MFMFVWLTLVLLVCLIVCEFGCLCLVFDLMLVCRLFCFSVVLSGLGVILLCSFVRLVLYFKCLCWSFTSLTLLTWVTCFSWCVAKLCLLSDRFYFCG